MAENKDIKKDELNDADLDGVTGGKDFQSRLPRKTTHKTAAEGLAKVAYIPEGPVRKTEK